MSDRVPLYECVFTPAIGAPRAAAAESINNAMAEVLQRARHRYAEVAKQAYFIAEQRHFEPGHELEDWLKAEALVAANSRIRC
jgi:phosphoglycolate phosphatase-like HAD superfamily hydrolase